MIYLEIIKFICLFLSVWGSLINVGKLIRGSSIPTKNLIVQAIGITGFIYLQWIM